MRFHTTIQSAGKTATGIEVPPDVVEALGAGKKPAVRVTLAGYTYRSTVASRSGRFLIGVSADVREQAGVAAGDDVDVELELDTAPREVDLHPEFAQALDAEPEARRFFDGLSYSQRRWFAEPIGSAKSEETRQRRIAKALERLREGRGQR
jgi:Bacteriocin-protection, YdeI or OmpD-Associated/Domain of unknown function (DUF1905)